MIDGCLTPHLPGNTMYSEPDTLTRDSGLSLVI